jgi:hypothetical protein
MFSMSKWIRLTDHQKKSEIIKACNEWRIDDDWCLKLCNNLDLITTFAGEAHKVARKRSHYSARTIMEVLRHHSIASDDDKTYKISNDITPHIAKVTTSIFPGINGLFKFHNKRA